MARQGRTRSGDKQQELLKAARELFSQKGFKDTSVPEITAKAGTATGTFYLYYPSKEKLFMDIFLEENVNLKKEIMEQVNMDGDPLASVRELMDLNIQGMLANPILREWYNKEVFSKIEEKYLEQQGLEKLDFMFESYLDVIAKWQEEGKFRNDLSSGMIMALIGVIIHIDLHKEEIGLEYFPQIQDLLTEFIFNGLTPAA
jgi:AcrR family transcriptional regulator